MRLSLSARVIAVLLALLASFTAPGAAVAHGLAHHREHHRDHHRDHHGDHDHRVPHAAPHGSALRIGDAGALTGAGELVATHPVDAHAHPVLDLPIRPRAELAQAVLVPMAATVLVSAEVRVPPVTRVPHAALPRADPDAAPPPRLRGPPLR